MSKKKKKTRVTLRAHVGPLHVSRPVDVTAAGCLKFLAICGGFFVYVGAWVAVLLILMRLDIHAGLVVLFGPYVGALVPGIMAYRWCNVRFTKVGAALANPTQPRRRTAPGRTVPPETVEALGEAVQAVPPEQPRGPWVAPDHDPDGKYGAYWK